MAQTPEPGDWSRQFKMNNEKLASGDADRVADVVIDLERRKQESGLSSGEARQLAKARHLRQLMRSQ